MKPYHRCENAPLLNAISKRPGSDNELDLRRVNERRNHIETDARGCKWNRVRVNSASVWAENILKRSSLKSKTLL